MLLIGLGKSICFWDQISAYHLLKTRRTQSTSILHPSSSNLQITYEDNLPCWNERHQFKAHRIIRMAAQRVANTSSRLCPPWLECRQSFGTGFSNSSCRRQKESEYRSGNPDWWLLPNSRVNLVSDGTTKPLEGPTSTTIRNRKTSIWDPSGVQPKYCDSHASIFTKLRFL